MTAMGRFDFNVVVFARPDDTAEGKAEGEAPAEAAADQPAPTEARPLKAVPTKAADAAKPRATPTDTRLTTGRGVVNSAPFRCSLRTKTGTAFVVS